MSVNGWDGTGCLVDVHVTPGYIPWKEADVQDLTSGYIMID